MYALPKSVPSLINNSPLVTTLNAFLNSSLLGGLARDENTKIVKVQGYKARLENTSELYATIEEASATKTTDEWVQLLNANNIPAMKYNRMAEVFDDPHLKAVDFFEEREAKAGSTETAECSAARRRTARRSVANSPPGTTEPESCSERWWPRSR